LKGDTLVTFLKSGQHNGSYEQDKADLFYAIQLMGTNAVIYLDEMLELARLDLSPTARSIVNGLAVDTLIRIGPATSITVAKEMNKSESHYWSGQDILLALKAHAKPAIPILHKMIESGTIPSSRSKTEVENLILLIQTQR